jgi:hypothetical protein
MQIKSKWTMKGHFKHLRFKTFLMVSWGPNLMFFPFPTKALNICNSHTSATPKMRVHLGVIGVHPLHSPPFVRVCLTLKHIFGLMGLCTSHLVTNPMLGLRHLLWLGPLSSQIIVASLCSIRLFLIIPIFANLRYVCKLVLKIVMRETSIAFACK